MLKLLPPTAFAWLALASSALASEEEKPIRDNGEGYAGETTDKVVTFFSLGVALFFVLVIVLGTIIQSQLEKRKEQRKGSHFQRYGW